MLRNSVQKYFKLRVDGLPFDISYVLVIRGEFLDASIIEYMKNRFTEKCVFSLYQWDSVANNPNALEIAKYFNHISTFDKADADKYSWKYRPLFFINKYANSIRPRKCDILFMGSLHSDRIEILNYLKQYCAHNNLSFESHIYTKKLVYFKRKYINKKKGYIEANDLDMKFKSLSLQDCYKKYTNSKVVIDYTHTGQTGYTMRTIECLGCQCKLITNNKQVLMADFYEPNNICVYEDTIFEITDEFLKTDFKQLPETVSNRYSLESWLLDII